MRFYWALLGIAFSSSAFAFCGTYVGGSFGGNGTFTKEQGEIDAEFRGLPATFFPVQREKQFTDFSWESTLYVGWGNHWSGCFYYGLEAFARYFRGKDSNEWETSFPEEPALAFTAFHKTALLIGPWHFGFDGRFGFLLRPLTLIYGRLGAEWTKIEIHERTTLIGHSLNDSFHISLSSKKDSKAGAHLRAGLGIEQRLNRCFSLKLDYLFTRYGRRSPKGEVFALSSLGNPIDLENHSKVRIRNHALTLGLCYYFSK